MNNSHEYLESVVKERDDLRSQNERLWGIVQKQKEIIAQLKEGKQTQEIALPAPIQKVLHQEVTFEKADRRKSFVHKKAEKEKEPEEDESEGSDHTGSINSQQQKSQQPEGTQAQNPIEPKARKRVQPVISGTLFKKGNYFGGWKTRFYSLDDSGTLAYADSKEGEVLESISLKSCYVVPFYSGKKKPQDDEKHGLVLVEYKKSFFNSHISMANMTADGLPAGKIENRHVLYSNTVEERDSWLRSLSLSITKCRPQDELAQIFYSNTQVRPSDSQGKSSDAQNGNRQSEIQVKPEPKKMEKPTPAKRQSSLTNFKSSDPDLRASVAEWASVDPAQVQQTLTKARPSSLNSVEDISANFTDFIKEKDSNIRTVTVSLPSIVETEKAADRLKKAVLGKRSSSLVLDENGQISGALHIRSGLDAKSHSESAIDKKGTQFENRHSIISNEPSSKNFVEKRQSAISDGHRMSTALGKAHRNDQDQDHCLLQNVPIFLKDELPLLEQRKPEGKSKKTKTFADWIKRKGSDNGKGQFLLFGTTIQEATNCTRIQQGYEMPSILYRCIEYLDAKKAESEEGIYRLSGASSAITAMKVTFEKDGDFNLLEVAEYIDPHAVAGLLKSFLRELIEPLFTNDLRAELFKITDVKTREGKIQELKILVERLPLANYTCLKVLMGHLLRITQKADINKMPARNIAIVFSPTLAIPGGLFTLMLAEFSSIFVRKLTNNADKRGSIANIDSRGALSLDINEEFIRKISESNVQALPVIPPRSKVPHSIQNIQEPTAAAEEDFGSDIMAALANQLKDLETENQ